jgi:hypothetical protein
LAGGVFVAGFAFAIPTPASTGVDWRRSGMSNRDGARWSRVGIALKARAVYCECLFNALVVAGLQALGGTPRTSPMRSVNVTHAIDP